MIRVSNGEVAPLCRLRAGLSPVAWRRLSIVERLQCLYGLSLDAALTAATIRIALPLAPPLATM